MPQKKVQMYEVSLWRFLWLKIFNRLHHINWHADADTSQVSVCRWLRFFLHPLFLFICKGYNTHVENQVNDASCNKKKILSVHQIFNVFLKRKVKIEHEEILW